MEESSKFEKWAVIELFGHQRIAGRVSEQQIGGTSFIRVDVPEVDGEVAFTKLLGGAAIYAITPVSEKVARLAAASLAVCPVKVWIPKPEAQLPAPDDYDEYAGYDYGDEYDEYDEFEDLHDEADKDTEQIPF